MSRHLVTLGSGELVGRMLGFVAMIYIARTLGVEAYGVVGFGIAVILYFWAAVDWGVDLLGPRWVAEKDADLPTLIPSILAGRLGAAALFAGLLALLGAFALPQPEGAVVSIYGLSLFGVAANSRWAHIGLDRSRPVAGSRIGGELLRLLVILWLVSGPADVTRVPLARVAAEIAGAVFLLALLGRHLARRPRFDRDQLIRAVRGGWPLMATTLLGLLIYNSDLIFLRIFRGRADVGLYLAAYALITFLGNLGTVVRQSLIPTLTRLREDEGRQAEIADTTFTRLSVLGFPAAVGGFLTAGGLIELIFGAEYGASANLLRILIWTIPILLWRSVFESILIVADRQRLVLRQTGWGAVVNVTTNLAAIPLFGMLGAATTSLLAEIVRSLLARRYVRREHPANVATRRLWRPAAAALGMGAVLLLVDSGSLWIDLPVGVATYAALLTAAGGIRLRGRRLELTV